MSQVAATMGMTSNKGFVAKLLGIQTKSTYTIIAPKINPDGKTTYVMGFAITNLNEYFMMFVVMAGTASIILFILASKLKKMMD